MRSCYHLLLNGCAFSSVFARYGLAASPYLEIEDEIRSVPLLRSWLRANLRTAGGTGPPGEARSPRSSMANFGKLCYLSAGGLRLRCGEAHVPQDSVLREGRRQVHASALLLGKETIPNLGLRSQIGFCLIWKGKQEKRQKEGAPVCAGIRCLLFDRVATTSVISEESRPEGGEEGRRLRGRVGWAQGGARTWIRSRGSRNYVLGKMSTTCTRFNSRDVLILSF